MPPYYSDTLHLSSSASTATNPISRSQFPANLPSPSRCRSLSFPSLSSTSTSISLPVKPPKFPPFPPPIPNSDFEEKMLFLESLGIDLFSLISAHPPIISASASDIKSVVEFLRSAASLTSADLSRISGMCPEILTSKTSSVVPVLTFLLREAGVSGSSLRQVIHRRPRLLACDVKTRLRPTLYFLQGTIGIAEIRKHTYLLSCSVEDKFIPRLNYFRKIGLSERETKSIFRRFPPLFCYSIEQNLEPKFNYLVVEMGRDLNELVEFPQYFSFSLENRVKPRHRKCVDRGVSLSLPLMLKSSEQRFMDKVEVCCDSSMPVRSSPLWSISCDDEHVS